MTQYKVKCFWGTEAAGKAEEEEHAYRLDYEPVNGYDITEELFQTEGELQAFLKGVDMSSGWDKFLIHEMT